MDRPCSQNGGILTGRPKPTGKRLLGRLRRKSEDNIRMELKGIGINT